MEPLVHHERRPAATAEAPPLPGTRRRRSAGDLARGSIALAMISLGLGLASSCAGPLARLTVARELSTAPVRVEVKGSDEAERRGELARAERALARALPRLPRWTPSGARVTVWLVPSQPELFAAARQPPTPWLRAWAEYDSVLLQSPAGWLVGDEAALDELLVHELTHAFMFQRSAAPDSWRERRVPFWFREGLAVDAAGQGALAPPLEALARWCSERGLRELSPSLALLARSEQALAYAVAYQALRFLVARFGADAPPRLMDAMRGGLDFATAFSRVTPLALRSFERDFLNFLKLRGFAGAGLPVGRESPRRARERGDVPHSSEQSAEPLSGP